MRRASAVRYGWEKLYIRRGRQKIQTEDTVGKIDYERFTICLISRLRGFRQTMSKLEMTVFDGDFFFLPVQLKRQNQKHASPDQNQGNSAEKRRKNAVQPVKDQFFPENFIQSESFPVLSSPLTHHASVHLKDMVAENLDILGIVAGEQNGFSLFLFGEQQGTDFFDTVPVKAVKRFIKD